MLSRTLVHSVSYFSQRKSLCNSGKIYPSVMCQKLPCRLEPHGHARMGARAHTCESRSSCCSCFASSPSPSSLPQAPRPKPRLMLILPVGPRDDRPTSGGRFRGPDKRKRSPCRNGKSNPKSSRENFQITHTANSNPDVSNRINIFFANV